MDLCKTNCASVDHLKPNNSLHLSLIPCTQPKPFGNHFSDWINTDHQSVSPVTPTPQTSVSKKIQIVQIELSSDESPQSNETGDHTPLPVYHRKGSYDRKIQVSSLSKKMDNSKSNDFMDIKSQIFVKVKEKFVFLSPNEKQSKV